jgi:Conjugal transfer protein TraD
MDEQTWLTDKLAYIEGLSKPSERLQLLAVLAKKKERTQEDERTLRTLIRAERSADRAANAQSRVLRLLKVRVDHERRARNYQLIQRGLLFETAKISEWPNETLLGALIEITKQPQPETLERWKKLGTTTLNNQTKEPLNG